jgi:Holliday junction resolvase RusA-like endonuclease
MTSLTFSVPGLPPSSNHAYQHTAGGGKRRTAEVIAWQTSVGQVVSNAALWGGWCLAPKQPFTLTVALHAPRLYGFDCDNCLKITQDAIVQALGLDDRYIVALTVTKARAAAPATVVTVTAGEGAE